MQSRIHGLWWRDYHQPSTPFHIKTKDGVTLHGLHFKTGHDTLVIYCHGFLSNTHYLTIPHFVELLAEDADVIVFDFRGHGESTGATTLGDKELYDVQAIVDYAQSFNYRHMILVGSSMGGAVAIRYAAESPEVAGVATIGAYADTNFGLLSNSAVSLFRVPVTHHVVRAVRKTHVHSVTPSTMPKDVVQKISPRPLLLIHGALDPIVHPRHAHELYQRAHKPKQLVLIPRGSHDISNLNRSTKNRIVEWMKKEIGE